jgi:predicted small secreted protein
MPVKKIIIRFCLITIFIMCAALLTACGTSTGAQRTPEPGIRTWLLVKAPENPLPLEEPITDRSRTEDGAAKVSHVELYALEMPGQTDVLIRSDRAPFNQTSFTAAQTFTPLKAGHYVIQVVGYNQLGETSASNIIGFDVE